MTVRGPFFTRQRAAAYCGVSAREFDRWRKQYIIPTNGPTARSYAASVLDLFMADPHAFQIAKPRSSRPISLDELSAPL
ncbi:MAG: DNA-binding protein [Pseudodesulfovibrio sp.]|nr:DNA-binding protein [Pseudodesulfovibrio sp.]